MGRPVIVLFEDSRSPAAKTALDDLLISCVADTLDVEDRQALRRCLEVRLCKGNHNLLDDCRHVDDIARRGELVVAVFDDDKVRRLLSLPARAPQNQVEAAIKKGCPNPAGLEVVLLDKNMETLLRAARDCHVQATDEIWTSAIQRKRLNARDQILKKLAFGARTFRDCVRKRLRSFEQLVTMAAQTIG